MDILKQVTGFEWDKYNLEKNWKKHKVKFTECEQMFFNDLLYVFADVKHSKKESRWYALGVTDHDRKLFAAFTIRKNRIRVISVRNMKKKERREYEELKKST